MMPQPTKDICVSIPGINEYNFIKAKRDFVNVIIGDIYLDPK